jgi:hypothetical protein
MRKELLVNKYSMKRVSIKKLSNIRMAAGNEKLYPTVIFDGIVHDWVAIGWIKIREATDKDYEKYPVAMET